MGENFTLGCPVCKQELGFDHAGECAEKYGSTRGVIDMIPSGLYSSAHWFEACRYAEIAGLGPVEYAGLDATYPKRRVEYIASLLEKHSVAGYVNVGPGFGFLEKATQKLERCVVDLCYGFLFDIKNEMPDVTCLRGLAEHLPFLTGSVKCLIADSTFQSVINREQFLYEIARVTTIDSLLILSIAYKWNYPRRPQNGFNVNLPRELEVLKRFVAELGFEAEFRFYDTPGTREVQHRNQGDYLWIVGQKTR